jgi:long-subunit acyl-CoA synthetase (AMP-forming)
MATIDKTDLLLERAYKWERERANDVWMVQPLGGGATREYTWKIAMDEARRMAAHLQSMNLPRGSSIAILSKNCAHFIMSELAIWMAGHKSVALYPTLTADTVRYILDHSESRLIFVGKLDTWDEMKPGVPADMPRISYKLSPPNDYPVWEDIVAKVDPIAGNPERGEDETAFIMYTSGTTGKPKGVEHTFGTISFAARGFCEVLDLRPDDRMLSYLPLAHAFERAAIESTSLRAGTKIFFAESLDTFVKDIQRARPTVFHSVPRLWLKFQHGVHAKMPAKKLATLLKIPILSGIVRKKVLSGLGLDQTRFAVSGSAPIPPELLAWYNKLGLPLLEGYGMSENFSYSHVNRLGNARIGYVGQPMAHVDVKLSPEGEVLVKSPATMKGYFKLPEATREAFTEDGYLRTGDRGEIDSEGRLKITGRVKELFKSSKGKYIAPAPIENILTADGTVEQACVTGHGHPQPFAVVVLAEELRKKLAADSSNGLRGEIESQLSALREKANAQLDPHEHLEFLVVAKEAWAIENGFLTPTLKVKRNVIEDRYSAKADSWYDARKAVIWESA